jgi:hypothetical protein
VKRHPVVLIGGSLITVASAIPTWADIIGKLLSLVNGR